MDRGPLPITLERDRLADSPLAVSRQGAGRPASDRLYISDSNHNRIVIATQQGELIETIGSGLIGDADGIFSQARFHRPQGLALDRSTLYVADTENHQIRAVDLDSRIVETVAGTGRQAIGSSEGGEASKRISIRHGTSPSGREF